MTPIGLINATCMLPAGLSVYHYVTCSMLKNYLPYIALIAAAAFFIYVKMHQRGNKSQKLKAEQTEDRITVPAVQPLDEKPQEIEARPDDLVGQGFDRNTTNLIFSKHARCRMDCRKIDESEIREILKSGTINYKKIQNDKRGKTYPVEGLTHDKQHVRIVFAPKDDGLVVVTVIDLDTEWSCNCK